MIHFADVSPDFALLSKGTVQRIRLLFGRAETFNYNLLNETFGQGEFWKRKITLNRLHQMTAKRIRMVKKAFRLWRERQRNNDPKLWIIVPDSSENRDSHRPGGGQPRLERGKLKIRLN